MSINLINLSSIPPLDVSKMLEESGVDEVDFSLVDSGFRQILEFYKGFLQIGKLIQNLEKVKELSNNVKAIQNYVKDLDTAIQKDKEAVSTELDKVKGDIKAYRAQIVSLDKTLKAKTEELNNIASTLSIERGKALESLTKEMDEYKKQVLDELDTSFSTKKREGEEQLSALERQINITTTKLSDLRTTIAKITSF